MTLDFSRDVAYHFAADHPPTGPISTITPLHETPIPDAEVVRLLAAWTDDGRADNLRQHTERYGGLPRGTGGGASRHLVIDAVIRSGLRGRGGAGFPTGEKLAAVAATKGQAVVVANGCESDPTSSKDHTLMQLAPHLVLDGIALACYALDARDAVLCVHQASPAIEPITAAIAERTDPVPVTVVEVPQRFVAGESSALVNLLTTGIAVPTVTPPRAARRGVKGRPTLVDNVETLANIALIARFGDTWFREAGTEDSPGSTLITIGGAVTWPGVFEVEFGIPLSDALELAGGESESLQAVAIGGLGGTWLPMPEAMELELAHETCADEGVSMGVAALVALPTQACGIAETARMLDYLAGQSAGQCGPCMFGLPAIALDMAALAAGQPDRTLLPRLRRRLGVIPGRGACHHPDATVRMVASALHTFEADAEAHARGNPCAWVHEPAWTPMAQRIGEPA